MNRRTAIRALLVGAPAAAMGMVAAPTMAGPNPPSCEAGFEPMIDITVGRIDYSQGAIARAIGEEVRRQVPALVDRHNRNPLRRAG